MMYMDSNDEFLTIGDLAERFLQRDDVSWADKAVILNATVELFTDLRNIAAAAHYRGVAQAAQDQADGMADLVTVPSESEDAAVERARRMLG